MEIDFIGAEEMANCDGCGKKFGFLRLMTLMTVESE